jgi:exonuclease VII small subunit
LQKKIFSYSMGLYITINGMNDKLKNSGESYIESPEDTLEMALDKALENFQYSPEILNHLKETLDQLNNTMT